jgi:hypothetical protein
MKKKKQIRKLIKGKRREELKQAGAYDGRFAPRVETPKKKYKRTKYRDLDEE